MRDDGEEWEADYYYIEQQDWPGLIRHREGEARRNPDSYYDLWRLGDAYIKNGDYKKAIEYLGKQHRRFPDGPDIQYSLLDALYAIDKSENDFDWVIKPEIIRLDQGLLDDCYEYLQPKRKPRSLRELLWLRRGYQAFSNEQFIEALQADGRFNVEGERSFAEISVYRKTRKK